MVALKVLLALTILFLLTVVDAFNYHLWNQRHEKFMLGGSTNKFGPRKYLPEQWFQQKLDHFSNDTTEWKQRFYQNSEHYNGNGIQFLYIGGESEQNGMRIEQENYPIYFYAQELKAQLWNLEHRFYGKSQPFEDLSTKHLNYLSGRQALADLANFIRSKNKELNIKDPKWVAFGGSYAGSLSLWFRAKYPDLTVGAVGSSAPIKLLADYHDYLRVVEDAYIAHDPKCADSIRQAIQRVDDLLDSKEGREQLDKLLSLNSSLSSQESLNETSLQTLFSCFQNITTQYTTLETVSGVCDILTEKDGDPVERLRRAIDFNNNEPGGYSVDYWSSINELRQISYENKEMAMYRAWIWQTCNEYGFFASTNYNGIFGVNIPTSFYYETCVDIFGKKYNVDYVQERIRQSVEFYGTVESYNATNVVITNGNLDPWSALGITESNDPSRVAIFINGTSHCRDIVHIASPSRDPQGLAEAQKVTFEQLKKWVGVKTTDKNTQVSLGQEARVEEKVKAKKLLDFESVICWNCELTSGNKSTKNPQSFSDPKTNLTESWIEQPFDHFDEKEKRTFKQRFYTNDKYYKKGGPIFLFIDNEASATPQYIEQERRPIIQWAKKFNAMIYLQEHRYYGESKVVVSPQTSEDFKFLTSQQALADCAHFIRKINKEKGYKNPKWISFGRSYGGSLSAWFKQLYPNDVYASYASSGPLQAEVDYYGYMKIVEKDLDLKVPNCSKTIRKAVEKIQQLIQNVEGREVLNKKFGAGFSGPSVDPFKVMEFYADVFGSIDAQHHIEKLHAKCQKLVESKIEDPIDAYISVFRGQGNLNSFFANSRLNKTDANGDVYPWWWQTCNEFGWYQSTDFGYNTFGSTIPVNHFLRVLCTDLIDFSFTRDKIEKNVQRTNEFYGGARGYKGSRVIQIYGSGDPWSGAGLILSEENKKNEVIKIVIDGTTHCEDMDDPKVGSNPQLIQEALDKVTGYFEKWINN